MYTHTHNNVETTTKYLPFFFVFKAWSWLVVLETCTHCGLIHRYTGSIIRGDEVDEDD